MIIDQHRVPRSSRNLAVWVSISHYSLNLYELALFIPVSARLCSLPSGIADIAHILTKSQGKLRNLARVVGTPVNPFFATALQ